jgi:hypothetical protein
MLQREAGARRAYGIPRLEESYNYVPKRKVAPLFSKASDEWMKERKGTAAEKTLSIGTRALKHLLRTFGPMLLSDITVRHVKRYRSARKAEGMAGRTVNLEVGVLRQVLESDDHAFWRAIQPHLKMLKERTGHWALFE